MEESIKSERRVNFTDTNQFINTSKSISSEERDSISAIDDSVLSICPQCNFSTSSIQSLDMHMEQEHGENSVNIPESEKTRDPVVKEEKIADDSCDKRGDFFLTSALDSQTKSESSSVNSSSIVAGKQISDSRRRYRCNICPVTFPWHGDLAAHLSEVHGFQKASRDGGKTRAGSYKCSFCMYVAKYQSELKRHRRLHMGVKPFGCVFCKYRSAWKGDLKRHIESHHRGHFNSEEELAAIMAQYKNNAGTDIKGTVEDDSHQEMSISQTKEDFTDVMAQMTEQCKFSESNETFSCDKCNFITTNRDKLTDHGSQCPMISFPIFDNQKTPLQAFSPSFEMGLNLTVPSHNSGDFPGNFNSSRNFHHGTVNSFPSLAAINDTILKIPTGINNPSDNSNSQILPSYMQGLNNELLSVMVSQNNISFNDIVGRMFSRMNGMLPPPILSKPILFENPTKPENIFVNSTPILSKASKPTSVTNFGIVNHQIPVSLQAANIDFPKSTEYEFPSPQKISVFENDKGFKSINGMLSCPRSISVDIKPKDNAPGLVLTQQEHWKRFKCSACGHRSNWKWDINKHIKVAHPERDGIATIELSYEEAKTTLQNYLNSTKANKARSHNSFESEEGYYRPYKCSACGHRSNWKWDVNKHIKQVHQRQAEVITLSMEEAKNTICQYKRRRRAPGLTNFSEHLSHTVTSTPTGSVVADKSNISSPQENNSSIDNSYSEKEKNELTWHDISPTTTNSQQQNPRIDTLRLKRLKCDCCGYRSNYRSDISRHIRRKHDNMASVVFLAEVVPTESLVDSQISQKTDLNETIDNDSSLKQITVDDINSQLPNQRKLWQCNLCSFSHKEKIQVSHHITRNHDPERPFNCKLCHYGTDYRNSLLRHVKAKHKISSINEVMNQNLSKVRFMPSLDNKLEQNGDLLKIDSTQCSKCNAVFSTCQDLFQHTVTNHSSSDEEMFLIFKPRSGDDNGDGSPINFSCSQCPFYCSNSSAAQIHQFQHSEICHYYFRCPHCNYKASNNKFLANHIGIHLQIHNFYQNDEPEDLSCPKIQTAIPNPITEESIIYPRKGQTLKRLSTTKIHCNRCAYRNSNIYHLRVHLQKCHYKKSLKRKLTERRRLLPVSSFQLIDENMFAKKDDNHQHNRFWCDECGFLASDESELKKHLLKHLTNNNNMEPKCTLCTYYPDSDKDLKDHELLHVLFEVSNFKDQSKDISNSLKCDKCNFSTNVTEKLEFHKHFHCMSSSHRGFSCPKCNFKHIQLYGLIKHLKYHH